MENTSENKRYSPAELKEFRAIIEKKLKRARREYNEMLEEIRNPEDFGEYNRNLSNNTGEGGLEAFAKETRNHMVERQAKFINNLEKAMIRIENGTYGICKVSGRLIPKERLRAVPHTTMCIDAKKQRPPQPTNQRNVF